VRPAHELWLRAIRELNIDESCAAPIWSDLEQRYGEPQRHYHTLDHIDLMAAELLRISSTPNFLLDFAILYHDAVYDARANINEEQSARLARDHLSSLGVDDATIADVSELIMCTKKHQPSQGMNYQNSLALLDLDLMILGAPADQYEDYAGKIRCEYEWVPEDQYRAGRAKVLRDFAERERIFFLPEFHDRFDKQARANLKREIDVLS